MRPIRFATPLSKLIASGLVIALSALPSSARELELGEVVDSVVAYLRAYSEKINGFSFPNIAIGLYGQSARSNCSNTHVLGSYYCPRDNTIVLEPIQLETLRRQWGDGAVAYALVHEYAHAIQSQARILLKDPYHELQADCLAGAILLSGDTNAKTKLGINRADAYEMISTAYSVGGGSVHGAGNQRSQALVQGARSGFSGCGLTMNSAPATGSTIAMNSASTTVPVIKDSEPSQAVVAAFNKWKDQACSTKKVDSKSNAGIEFDWSNPEAYIKRPYIISTSASGKTANIQLLGCLPFKFSVENLIVKLNAPKNYDIQISGISLCRPGYDLRPVICDRPLQAGSPAYDKNRHVLSLQLTEKVEGKSLFAVTLTSRNPNPSDSYQMNMVAGISLLPGGSNPVYGYLGTYMIGFKYQ